MDIGQIINNLRKEKKISQRKMASDLSITNPTISMWENGLRKPDTDTLKRLADYFNVPVTYFFEYDNINKSKGVKIAVLGTIPAGIPFEAIEDIIDYEEISEEMARTGEYFALKVQGDSMLPTIKNGDIVIVRKQDSADSGKICVVMINGNDATLKEIKKDPQGLWVLPHNPNADFQPTFFTNKEVAEVPVRIIGVAVEIRRSL